MPDKLILFLDQSWADLDREIDGSAIAWTVGHLTTQVDSWLNMRFQGMPPHPTFERVIFRTGGSSTAMDWPGILASMREVRATAKRFLDAEPGPDLERMMPYDGGITYLHATGLPLRFALMSIDAHHFQHVAEIVTIRSRLGHLLTDAPEWGRALL
jgi:hypothetical protein